MRGSIPSQCGAIWSEIDGIGTSKAEARDTSSTTNLTGDRPVSPLVHSLQYKEEVFRTAADLGQFAKEEFGIKNMETITGEVVQAWVKNKIENGVSRGTLENYISHLAKVEIGLEKMATGKGQEYQSFGREDLLAARASLTDLAKSEHVNRAYENPGAVMSNLEGKEYLVGRLQLEHGLRVSEAARIEAKQLVGNSLTFHGKGGYELTKTLPEDLANAIRENMQEGRFEINANHYRDSIRESARIEGEKYTGSHGLRYNFAQKTYAKLLSDNLDKGLSHTTADQTALASTSEEMGHHREEITHHYLR
ncbi:MAG: hypothetical protein ACYDIB_10505 [Desulfobulbia bacterium]